MKLPLKAVLDWFTRPVTRKCPVCRTTLVKHPEGGGYCPTCRKVTGK